MEHDRTGSGEHASKLYREHTFSGWRSINYITPPSPRGGLWCPTQSDRRVAFWTPSRHTVRGWMHFTHLWENVSVDWCLCSPGPFSFHGAGCAYKDSVRTLANVCLQWCVNHCARHWAVQSMHTHGWFFCLSCYTRHKLTLYYGRWRQRNVCFLLFRLTGVWPSKICISWRRI